MGAYWSSWYYGTPYHYPHRTYGFSPYYYHPARYHPGSYHPHSPVYYYTGDEANQHRDREPSPFHPDLIGSMIDAIQQYQTAAASKRKTDLQPKVRAALHAAQALGSSIEEQDAEPMLVSHVLALIDYTDAVLGDQSIQSIARHLFGRDRTRIEKLLASAMVETHTKSDIRTLWTAHLNCSTRGFSGLVEDTKQKDLKAINQHGLRQNEVSKAFSIDMYM